jgi:hypothetical protein
MTLSDVISKRIVFGQDAVITNNASVAGTITTNKAIVTDNSATDAILVTQTGTGSAIYANGKIRASDSIFSEQSFLSQSGIFTNYEGNDYIKLDPSDDSIRFFSNNAEVGVITTAGNVGLGTPTPVRKVHVVGTVRIQGLPTSAAGLSAGDVWNDGGTLKIV